MFFVAGYFAAIRSFGAGDESPSVFLFDSARLSADISYYSPAKVAAHDPPVSSLRSPLLVGVSSPSGYALVSDTYLTFMYEAWQFAMSMLSTSENCSPPTFGDFS